MVGGEKWMHNANHKLACEYDGEAWLWVIWLIVDFWLMKRDEDGGESGGSYG